MFLATVAIVRASRLLQLLLVLQARGHLTAPALAEELEVSVRTVYRDLEALSAAGVPVYTETGRNGGVRLVDGWRTRLTGLTGDEADTLPLLGMPAAAAELGLGTVLAATQVKVLAALPPELRSRASRVAERFHLDAPGWYHRDEPVAALAPVAEAVWEQRRLRLRYERRDRVVERTVEPLGIVLKAGTWYLVAVHRRRTLTYRVSRIRSATPLDERFRRPEGFDLAAHWRASSDEFEQTLYRLAVRARVRANHLPLLRSSLDPVAARSVTTSPDPVPGWVVAAFPGETVEVAMSQLLPVGAGLEVLDPPELRRAMADTTAAMAASYAGHGGAGGATMVP